MSRKHAFWVLAATLGLTSVALGEVRPIRFRNGELALDRKSPAQVRTQLSAVAAQSNVSRVIVQFERPVSLDDKARLLAAGIRLLDYLGDNGFYARVDGNRFNAAGLAAVPSLTRIGEIQMGQKLHPDLLFDRIHDWMIVGAKTDSEEGVQEPNPDPVVAVYVKFHKDVPLDAQTDRIIYQSGGLIRSHVTSINTMVVELPYSQIKGLANHSDVEWIEPPLPRFSELNQENRARVGADIVQAAPYGLNGAGVTALVYDGGRVRTTHQDFQGRAIIGSDEWACTAVSDHSTHVAGTIAGAGVADPTEKGMAPAANIVSYGFNEGPDDCSLSAGGGWLYTNPGDMVHDYNTAINTHGADIANNSIGTNTAPNGFDCTWEGQYGLCSSTIDAIVRGSLGSPFRIVWANGNERQVTRCGTTYNTTAPPACAKNHITVGAMNANDDSVTSFTSWGPTEDGRMKPDISAPGCEVGNDSGIRSCSSSSDTAYSVKCGTSMASPTVCGISALLLQDYRVQYPARPDFRNSTLKILLAHTAVDLFNPGPDNQTGYGSVRIQPAVDFMRSGNFLENTVDQGGSYNVLVIVNPGDPVMKVTLAWDDPESGGVTIGTLVNDLDLVVFDPNNVQRFPWTLDIANPGNPAVQTQKNSLDNIEQVFVNAPAPGVYRVEVRGFNVPQGPQPFSLCASPMLVNCSRQGVITLDRSVYRCTSPATITVVDCDLNTDDQVVETVNVTIASTTEAGGETVTLTETGPQTALFRGSINFDTTNSPGVLQVAHGDSVTATYIDADDGQGGINVTVTANAAVDCVAPVISNVQVQSVDPHSGVVTFTTDEPAKGTVRYGTSCGTLSQNVVESGFGTSHTIPITGLLDDTQYFLAIDAADPAGNSTTDDNGGACYTFTTPQIPDSLTEEFVSDFDLDNTSIMFTPNGSIDVYAMCSTAISVLPTDPAGGTPLTLADNANANVALGGGAQVSLYGVNYSNFFVGSNGYITFGIGDTDSTPTILDHFDTPRISAIFSNLNPAIGGTVSWKQLADRAVVTFENVPQASTTNINTFQYELFFDGRIRLSFLQIDVISGITGLSAGAGIPLDYTEMNLSAAPTCGPQPPAAASRFVESPVNVPINITLIAGDDGIPGPLSYIITSLPTAQLEDLGNSHTIVPGDLPYTLSGGGNQVRYYTPAAPVVDSFQFKVNDGGTPPTGGDSNTATVTINVQPVLALPFFDDFPTTTFDPLKWQIVDTATIDGLGIAEPSEPNSARFNGDPNGGDEIRTHLVNLGGETTARLTYYYQIRGGGESPDANDDLFVEFLNNVGTWELINQHLGSGADMTTYQQVSLLLPASAFHPAFRLRFRNTATSGNFDDWFVDNVSIVVPNSPEAQSTSAATSVNTAVSILLPATDPNGDTLTWIILSLPTNGLLKDPNGGIISSVPYSLLGAGDDVLYKANFNYQGPDQFTFKVTDGVYESNVANVGVTVGGPQVIHSFPLDTDPGWTADAGPGPGGPNNSGWALGTPTNTASCGADRLDPTGGFTGANVYGYNLAGCYTNNLTTTRWLTTTAMSCSGATGIQLRFRRWLGVESASFDHAYVEVSTNGTTWTQLWSHTGATLNEQAWSLQTLNAPAADNQATVYFRWGIGTTDGSVVYQGWNIDDIEVIGNVPQSCPPVTPGDVNGDGSVDSRDIQDLSRVLVDPFLATSTEQCAADVNQDNAVDLADAAAMGGLLVSLP